MNESGPVDIVHFQNVADGAFEQQGLPRVWGELAVEAFEKRGRAGQAEATPQRLGHGASGADGRAPQPIDYVKHRSLPGSIIHRLHAAASQLGGVAHASSETFMISFVARGSRRPQRPASTMMRKSQTERLNKSGSSRLRVWPVLGRISRPQAGSVFLRKSEGCRQ